MRLDVICDFDGTIAREDVTDGLLERFADPAWHVVEADWVAGRIGSRECLARQIGLVQASRAQICDYLDTVEIDPAFATFLGECRARGIRLRIASDGLDFAIDHILGRHGLPPTAILANHLVDKGEGRWALEFPLADAGCSSGAGTCKCAAVSAEPGVASILIGDGRSDFCAAEAVDLVFAKDRLLTHVAAKRIRHLSCPDFATACRLLARLTAGATDRTRLSARMESFPHA